MASAVRRPGRSSRRIAVFFTWEEIPPQEVLERHPCASFEILFTLTLFAEIVVRLNENASLMRMLEAKSVSNEAARRT